MKPFLNPLLFPLQFVWMNRKKRKRHADKALLGHWMKIERQTESKKERQRDREKTIETETERERERERERVSV